jgi:hypothetical protein
VRGDRLNLRRLIVGILDDADAGNDAALGEHLAGDAADDLPEAIVHNRPVIDFRSFVLSQADEHHLHQARFDVADEVRVRLDAADDEHVIGKEGVLVEVDGKTLGRLANDDRLHARADRAAAERLGHSVPFDQFALPFGRAAAVASHRRHDERLGPEPLQVPHGCLNDQGDISNPATAGSDSDRLATFDAAAEFQPRKFCFDGGLDLIDRERRRIERLANAEEKRVKRHGHQFGSAKSADEKPIIVTRHLPVARQFPFAALTPSDAPDTSPGRDRRR